MSARLHSGASSPRPTGLCADFPTNDNKHNGIIVRYYTSCRLPRPLATRRRRRGTRRRRRPEVPAVMGWGSRIRGSWRRSSRSRRRRRRRMRKRMMRRGGAVCICVCSRSQTLTCCCAGCEGASVVPDPSFFPATRLFPFKLLTQASVHSFWTQAFSLRPGEDAAAEDGDKARQASPVTEEDEG